MRSCEGTTQGGSESGGFAKKIWYSDDGGGGGTLDQLLALKWQDLQKSGPLFGYFPKASKTWLIVKPGNLERAQTMFPDINIMIIIIMVLDI